MEAQGERLLQDLVKQEKSLLLKVDEAKATARTTLEKAEAQAAKLKLEAQAQADALAKNDAEAAAAEADSVREEVVSGAREAAQGLQQQAVGKLDGVVATLMEKVLP